METFTETSRRTTEANDEEDTKKKNRARHSGREAINYIREKIKKDLQLKKEENNIKLLHEERLRVSSENQFQLSAQVINDKREQIQKIVDGLQCMQQHQNQLIVTQLQLQKQSRKLFMAMLERLNKKLLQKTVFLPVKLGNNTILVLACRYFVFTQP